LLHTGRVRVVILVLQSILYLTLVFRRLPGVLGLRIRVGVFVLQQSSLFR